uniref:Uncharacterized protein n=1 Tax=Setaria viridis TaxID=4556 RepID=A0A4U6WLE3_SETVI|nr:hypothetical protein SEVIR_1G162350v2 [Setaria viridis]
MFTLLLPRLLCFGGYAIEFCTPACGKGLLVTSWALWHLRCYNNSINIFLI